MKKNKKHSKYLVSTSPNIEDIVSYHVISKENADSSADLTDVVLSCKDKEISKLISKAIDVKIGKRVLFSWKNVYMENDNMPSLYLIKIKEE